MLLVPALCAGLLFFSACRSDCARLCDKQAECAGERPDGSLSIEKQAELCRTMCETMSTDKTRAPQMEKAFACTGGSCEDFATCVKAAETVK
ncbi:MAG: hypothetical protein ACI9OJ_000845 [Myxococcota bacterium]|jgi:hypothetical protein